MGAKLYGFTVCRSLCQTLEAKLMFPFVKSGNYFQNTSLIETHDGDLACSSIN